MATLKSDDKRTEKASGEIKQTSRASGWSRTPSGYSGEQESVGEAAKTRKVTQGQGEAMLRGEPESELGKQGARLGIAGMDGSLIPIVRIETDEKAEK